MELLSFKSTHSLLCDGRFAGVLRSTLLESESYRSRIQEQSISGVPVMHSLLGDGDGRFAGVPIRDLHY